MSRSERPHILSFVLLCLSLAACSAEPSEAPAPQTVLTLDIEHVIGDQRVVVGQTYTTRYKQDVTFDHIRYWISNVTAVRGDERFTAPASYYLVEQTPERERLSVTVRGLPEGTYDAIVFHLGVDPPHNASLDKIEGELAPGIGMDWSWDTGYKFLRTEGDFVQKDLSGKFSFHTGMDVLYKELTAALPAPIDLVAEQEVAIRLEAEIDRIFAGIQLATDANVAGGTVDSPAAQIAGNYSRMFRLVTDDGTTALTATSPNLDGPVDDGEIPKDDTAPVLTDPVIALPDALVCGAVSGRPAEEERACMTPFVLLPESGATYDAGLYTFVTKNGEPVHASSPGLVSDVSFLEHSALTHSDLFLITVRPNADSAFFLEYRNIKDLLVAEGETVTAGQVLGGAGDYFVEDVGLVSFGVRRSQELTQRLCPSRYASSELSGVYGAALDTSNAAWPSHAEGALCASVSVLCAGGKCDPPSDFVAAEGDIDRGRRIYKASCLGCHGEGGAGDIGPELCFGESCTCKDCGDHAELAARVALDMPPEASCTDDCAADVAAFILHEFQKP